MRISDWSSDVCSSDLLNVALASKVQELARYRSEFFGRLREVLGQREDIRIVGDRFVFQSEVLFDTAEATLNPAGRAQIDRLADTLLELSKKIPSDIDRSEEHTSELQSLMRISYAVYCLKKKTQYKNT